MMMTMITPVRKHLVTLILTYFLAMRRFSKYATKKAQYSFGLIYAFPDGYHYFLGQG